jgi:hypothetical protein
LIFSRTIDNPRLEFDCDFLCHTGNSDARGFAFHVYSVKIAIQMSDPANWGEASYSTNPIDALEPETATRIVTEKPLSFTSDFWKKSTRSSTESEMREWDDCR